MTFLYFIQRGYGSIKIGVSDDPETRLSHLQTGAEKPLRLIAKFPMSSRAEAFAVEKEVHERFAHLRLTGEWFKKRLLYELKFGGKRLIGGTTKHPMVRTPTGWEMVDPPPTRQRGYTLRDLAIFRG